MAVDSEGRGAGGGGGGGGTTGLLTTSPFSLGSFLTGLKRIFDILFSVLQVLII